MRFSPRIAEQQVEKLGVEELEGEKWRAGKLGVEKPAV